MELEFESRTIAFLRQSIQGVCRQEQTQEVIVPDASPDASRVVYCCAQAVVRSKECRNGSVLLSGGVQASALYLTEEDGAVRTLDAWLPFTLQLEQSAAKEDTQILFDCRVCSADARLVNSRKLLFRVEVGAQIFGFSAETAEFPLLKNTPDGLQLRCRNYPIPLPSETAERSFLVSDELELPAGRPAAAAVIAANVMPEATEQRIVGNKAVFKGSMQVKILYLAADGSVNLFSQTLPFSQYCQLGADYDEDQMQLLLAVTGCDVQMQSSTEARSFLVSADLLAQCLVTRCTTLTFCEDAFSTQGVLTPEWAEFRFEGQLDRQTLRQAVRETLHGEALRGVIDSEVFPDFPIAEQTAQGPRLTVPLAMRVLGFDAEGTLCGLSGTAQCVCEVPAADGTVCRAAASLCPDTYAAPAPDGAELRCDLSLQVCTCAEQQLRTLSGGTIGPEPEAERRPSLIIRRTAGAVPIWDLAKQYRTSTESICAANDLSGDEAGAGTLLLIPM